MRHKLILVVLGAVGVGSLGTLAISKFTRSPATVNLPVDGGNFDCLFRAELLVDPDAQWPPGKGLGAWNAAWKWTIQNRSATPFQISIPTQKCHEDYGDGGGGPIRRVTNFMELPPELQITEPITLQPGESRVLLSQPMSWIARTIPDSLQRGFRVVARIDDTYHILACAATVTMGKLPMEAHPTPPQKSILHDELGPPAAGKATVQP